MEHEVGTDRHVSSAGDRTLVRGRAVGGDAIQPIAVLGPGPRNARVDDVHHPAHRRRAEQQRRWPAQHLNALGQERVDDHRMIDGGIGQVDRANTVRQHADALALETAQDGPGRRRAEGGRRHARQTRERLAK